MFISNFIRLMLTSNFILFPSDLCSPQISSYFLPISWEFLQIYVHKKIHQIFFKFRFTSYFISFSSNFIWFSTDLCLHQISFVFLFHQIFFRFIFTSNFMRFFSYFCSLQKLSEFLYISLDFLHVYGYF